MQDAAVRLFGSANLGHVVADLSHGAPVGSPDKSQDRDPSGLIARALRGEDESSEDSAVDDFRAMRKAVKDQPSIKTSQHMTTYDNHITRITKLRLNCTTFMLTWHEAHVFNVCLRAVRMLSCRV